MQARRQVAARLRNVRIDVLTDGAAALTYYTVLSLFPGLALLISALALIGGTGSANSVIEIISDVAPPSVAETLVEPIESMASDTGLSGAALVLSAVVSLFSASRYVAAFGRTADRIQGLEPGSEPFWLRRPLAMLLVGLIIVLLPLAVIALLITGPIAVAVANAVGLSSEARELFGILRWPLLAAVGAAMLTVLYLSSEGMRRAGPRRVLPGALAAIGVWLLASGTFSIFVANLTSFSLTYGSLAGVVVLLVWLYVSNLAALGGMLLNVVRLGGIDSDAATGGSSPHDKVRPKVRPK
jgi:membrane protein